MTYDSLGVVRVINAAAAQSVLGGSILAPGVADAMSSASERFVHVPELHDRVGERIAELTHNEAACLCCGAAAGVLVAVAACLVGDDVTAASELPERAPTRRREVIVWRRQANGYLAGAQMAGGEIRLIDDPDELDAAGAARASCVLWFPGRFPDPDEDEVLDRFLERSRALSVPLVVDAADQVPPISNLWYYTRDRGADLAIFSGGKGLRGPGASGLILGRSDLVRACRTNSGPEHSVGRPAKVGKEEMLGLLAAVEVTLGSDEDRSARSYAAAAALWARVLSEAAVPDVDIRTVATSHSGQPIPRVIVELSPARAHGRDALIDDLWCRTPRIAVLAEGGAGIALNPQMLSEGEVVVVIDAVIDALRHLEPLSAGM